VVGVVRLTEVFRPAANSKIITKAHRINEGLMPGFPEKNQESDFFFVDRPEPESIANTLVEMVIRFDARERLALDLTSRS
jgi:exodeoxyribonuclease V alpha subunit